MSDLVLKWYWRHHSLYVEEEESVADAVASLYWAQEDGSATPGHIDIVSPGGAVRRIDGEELDRLIHEKDRQATERYRATADQHPVVAKVVVVDGDQEAVWEWYRDMPAAQQEADRLRPYLGDRVRVEAMQRALGS